MRRRHILPLTLLLAALAARAEEPALFRHLIPVDVPIREEKPATEAAFTQATQAVDGDGFGVKLELQISRGNKAFRRVPLATPICDGDSVAFTFTPTGAGYVQVFNHGTSGKPWSLIYPVRDTEPRSFSPAQPVRLPADPLRGFPVSGPGGTEYVMVAISPKPFTGEQQRFGDRVQGREEAGQALAPAEAGTATRAVQVTFMRDLGAAEAVYVVGQGEQNIALELDHRVTCGELP